MNVHRIPHEGPFVVSPPPGGGDEGFGGRDQNPNLPHRRRVRNKLAEKFDSNKLAEKFDSNKLAEKFESNKLAEKFDSPEYCLTL